MQCRKACQGDSFFALSQIARIPNGGKIPDLAWEPSDEEIMAEVAEIVCRHQERRRNGGQAWAVRLGPDDWGGHRAGPAPATTGIWWDWRDAAWRNSFDQALVTNSGALSTRHVFEGGRCGGTPPAQGRPLAAERP